MIISASTIIKAFGNFEASILSGWPDEQETYGMYRRRKLEEEKGQIVMPDSSGEWLLIDISEEDLTLFLLKFG